MLSRASTVIALIWLAAPVGAAFGQLQTKLEAPTSVTGRPGATVTIPVRLLVKAQSQMVGFAGRPVKFYYRFYYVSNKYVLTPAGTVTTNWRGEASLQVRTPGLSGRRFVYDVVFEGDGTGRRATASVIVASR